VSVHILANSVTNNIIDYCYIQNNNNNNNYNNNNNNNRSNNNNNK
jgi:hypothetical protein